MGITRKQFLKGALGAAVGGLGLTALAACGGDDDDGPATAGGGGSGNTTSSGGSGGGGSCDSGAESLASDISANHPGGMHTLTIPAADIVAAVEKTYSIKGASAHDHTVTVTASHFATLQNGGSIPELATEPDGSGHSHKATISCA